MRKVSLTLIHIQSDEGKSTAVRIPIHPDVVAGDEPRVGREEERGSGAGLRVRAGSRSRSLDEADEPFEVADLLGIEGTWRKRMVMDEDAEGRSHASTDRLWHGSAEPCETRKRVSACGMCQFWHPQS